MNKYYNIFWETRLTLIKKYTQDERPHMVEQYFWTNSYKTAVPKIFFLIPNPNIIWQDIGTFETKFSLEDLPRAGRPSALSSEDWTHLLEHRDENPRCRTWFQAWNSAYNIERGILFLIPNFYVARWSEPPYVKRDDCSEAFFRDRLFLRGRWPARSSSMYLHDLFWWGFLKYFVYRNQPRTE